jgi:hypothetical protein
MVTAKDYQELAVEFFKSADEAETEEMRDAFLQLARNWMLAALRIDDLPASTGECPTIVTTWQ